MNILEILSDLDTTAARAERRRIVEELRRSSERRWDAFNRTWRCPIWNDTDAK
jgi:hypothetical protein